MALLGYPGLLHDALHLPEQKRCAFAGGEALPDQIGHNRPVGQSAAFRVSDSVQQGLFVLDCHQRLAVLGNLKAVGRMQTGALAKTPLMGEGLSRPLTDGFPFPLRHRAQHIEHQPAGRGAGIKIGRASCRERV